MSRIETGRWHRLIKRVAQLVFVLGLSTGRSAISWGQSVPAALPLIVFKDTVLAQNLSAFASQNRQQIIHIDMHAQDSVRIYTITSVYLLQTLESLANVRHVAWGQWWGRTVAFSADSTLFQLCTVTRPATINSLIDHAERLLGQKRITARERRAWATRGLVVALKECVTVCNAPEWRFGVKNNREEWLSTTGGFDSREIVIPECVENQ